MRAGRDVYGSSPRAVGREHQIAAWQKLGKFNDLVSDRGLASCCIYNPACTKPLHDATGHLGLDFPSEHDGAVIGGTKGDIGSGISEARDGFESAFPKNSATGQSECLVEVDTVQVPSSAVGVHDGMRLVQRGARPCRRVSRANVVEPVGRVT